MQNVNKYTITMSRICHLNRANESSKGKLTGKAEWYQGGHQGWVYLGKMVLMEVRQGGWTTRAASKGKPMGITRLEPT
jgi:hypothetical protein